MQDKIKVFKVETFGAVDGPGIRLVIFVLGCNFRCKYCHNPESWNLNYPDAKEMSISDIISLYDRNKEFYEKGGITISGGEPMLHPEFIKNLGLECKKRNIHLAIDTSACNFLQNKQVYQDLLDLVDLWIVDIKAFDKKEHQFITGFEEQTGVELIKFLEKNNKDFWARQVVIQGINANQKHLDLLADFVKPLKHCLRCEILSYHNLAEDKYNKLGIKYPFKDIPMLSTKEFEEKKTYLNNKINN